MSINVTVSGNPVSINRGKMVTADPNYHKSEFEKRRLIRLEQVRQQSKDIAQDVRNKVRKEKKKQMKQIEEEGSERLKNWQNRKLLELQNQYKDALDEIGGAHRSAADLEDENDLMAQQDKQNEQRTRNRNRIAATKLQVEKNEKSLAKSIPIQRRKIVKEVENVRSAMVSNLGKKDVKSGEPSKKKKRRTSADINITIPDESSDSEYSEVVDGVTPDSNHDVKLDEATSSSCVCTESSDSPRDPLQLSADKVNGTSNKDNQSSYQQFRLNNGFNQASKNNSSPSKNKIRDVSPPLDNRISERIKRRDLMAPETEYCSVCAKTNPIVQADNSTKIRDVINTRHREQHNIDDGYAYNMNNSNTRCSCTSKRSKPCQRKARLDNGNESRKSENVICECFKTGCPCTDMHRKNIIDHDQFHPILPDIQENSITKTKSSQEIPVKPRIALKELIADNKTSQSSTASDLNKVQYYDHPNRFSHVKSIPSGSHVEKITADSLEVIPNLVSEREWYEKMHKRDKDAEIRGQKALEKERIQRDYKELLKKLPVLQKKERICEISKDKPEYHMSEDRLKEKERQRQNQMENAYNGLFPDLKPAVVTLPKTNPPDRSPDSESVQSINVGKWDVDYNQPKMFTAEEVQEIVQAYTNQDPKQRQEKLKELLRSLKLQKEQLLAEIKRLPVNESVNKLIDDLNSFSESKKTGKKDKEKSKRKRCECDFDSTGESTTSVNLGSDKQDERHKQGTGKRTGTPRKKAKKKSRKKVLILQNTSTQTTPKVEIVAPNKEEPTEEKPKVICNKLHVPCDCNKDNKHVTDDELCQIFIKLHDDETPEVVVKSNEKEKRGVSPKGSLKKVKKATTKSVAVGPDEKERSAPRKLSTKHLSKDVLDKAKASTARKSKDIAEELGDKMASKKERQPKGVSKDVSDWKRKSWREQLSKNSISTSSTSYWSPPDFQKSKDSQMASHISSFYNLKGQPKQKNALDAVSMESNRSARELQADPAMLQFVKKLLSMSRGSIENLNVSSVSTVPTPSQSIVEVENNNPAAQLQNLIRFFNEKATNIAKDLSYSPDGTALHYNSSASTSSLDKQQPAGRSADQSAIAMSDGSRSMVPERDSSNSHQSRDSVLAQYTDITDSCSKRIETLATMIQKIRDEKMQMLQNQPGVPMDAGITHKSPVASEKDYSTKYLDLPTSKEGSTHSSSASLDEEEVYRRLIEIDLGMANKLRQLSTQNEQNVEKSVGSAPPVNDELWTRLQRLKQNDVATKSKEDDGKNPTFVPFLSDIPKLPKFEAQPDNATPSYTDGNVHRKPPPSKGLTVAKKFNGNISLVPHELSTIVEADSQLSTRLGSTSPNASKTSQNLAWKDIDLIIFPQSDEANEPVQSKSPSLRGQENVVVKSPRLGDNYGVTKEQKPKDVPANDNTDALKVRECNDSTCSKQSSHSKSTKLTSSSSSDDIETVEAMLKSIGMAWAIPTLHKTQKALALSSSSSSLDLSALKKGLSNESSGSEVSVKDFLRKQLMSKISSSTFKSDASPGSILGEFSDMSAINAANSSADKERHKTSTPITTSKSTSKSRESFRNAVFSGDSEISSVRNESKSN